MLADWVKSNSIVLNGPDRLEPLREVVGDARIVAIGEGSHYIREYAELRLAALRFLVRELGFTLFCFESGFAEGLAIDAWIKGGPEVPSLSGAAWYPEARAPFDWLREHNRTAAEPVTFGGVDIPVAGGSLLPCLEPVAAYLSEVDEEPHALVREAIGLAEQFAGASMAASAPVWSRLPVADQDRLTALLSRARVWLRTHRMVLRQRDPAAYDLAVHHLAGAAATEYHQRGLAGMFAGGRLGDTGAREVYLADSVRWHLARQPGARMVLMAHNAHIQRTPAGFPGLPATFPMGQHLAEVFGADYLPIALMSAGGRTAAMHPDESAPLGFTVEQVPLPAPAPSSLEALLAPTGLSLLDLRGAPRGGDEPDRTRVDSGYLHTPVLDGYDAVIHVPDIHVVDQVQSLIPRSAAPGE